MHLSFEDVATFVRVAELGTLSAAARERNVPVSQVTRSLARLEARVGVRRMHRTTHRLSQTHEGDKMLADARRLLETTPELDGELRGRLSGPSGWVRVSMSLVIGQVLVAPSLAKLYERHPRLQLDLTTDDRVADLARDGIDVALRTGELDNEILVARRLGHFSRTVVASPLYLERFGAPRTLDELAGHHLIAHSINPQMNRWPVRSRGKAAFFQVRGQTRSDDVTLTLALLRQGVGIGRVMDMLARPLIRSGKLVALLEDQIDPQRVPIHALMLPERHRLPKVRACIEYWTEWISTMQTT
jgi:DNA-binding transcriptional LysR family regulator